MSPEGQDLGPEDRLTGPQREALVAFLSVLRERRDWWSDVGRQGFLGHVHPKTARSLVRRRLLRRRQGTDQFRLSFDGLEIALDIERAQLIRKYQDLEQTVL